MKRSNQCGCVILGIAFIILVWFLLYNSPFKKAQREREREDAALADWLRAKQLREMRADKTKGEQP